MLVIFIVIRMRNMSLEDRCRNRGKGLLRAYSHILRFCWKVCVIICFPKLKMKNKAWKRYS